MQRPSHTVIRLPGNRPHFARSGSLADPPGPVSTGTGSGIEFLPCHAQGIAQTPHLERCNARRGGADLFSIRVRSLGDAGIQSRLGRLCVLDELIDLALQQFRLPGQSVGSTENLGGRGAGRLRC